MDVYPYIYGFSSKPKLYIKEDALTGIAGYQSVFSRMKFLIQLVLSVKRGKVLEVLGGS